VKFMTKPTILKMPIKTKLKKVWPSKKLRIFVAQTTSSQRSPRTTKRKWFSKITYYLNMYSNNKPNQKRIQSISLQN
jgi:hypothetical protein